MWRSGINFKIKKGEYKIINTILREDCRDTIQRNDFYQDYVITGQPEYSELGMDPKKKGIIEEYNKFIDDIYERLQEKVNLITLMFTDRKQNSGIITKSAHNINLFTQRFGFKVKTYKIWHKQEVPTINLFRLSYSHIITFCKNDNIIPKNKVKGFMYDIFNIKHKNIDGFTHGFPQEIINLLILKYSNEGQIIYDPFCGSGTVPLECLKTNRNFIQSEISEETYNIQTKRLEDFKNKNRK